MHIPSCRQFNFDLAKYEADNTRPTLHASQKKTRYKMHKNKLINVNITILTSKFKTIKTVN